MRVTRIHIDKLPEHHRLKAFCDIVIDNNIRISGIKITKKGENILIQFPMKERKKECPNCLRKCDITCKYCQNCGAHQIFQSYDGNFHKSIVNPMNAETRAALEEPILEKYFSMTEEHLDWKVI